MGRREQNRARTLDQIQRATLDLLEAQGLETTTVGQIAARAGISERTFFRYYPSKESAALPGVRDVKRALLALELHAGNFREVLEQLLQVCRSCFAVEVEHYEFRRISRLLIREPELMTTVAQQERELVELLRDKLETQLQIGSMCSLLAAEIAISAWRVAWQSYARTEVDGTPGDPLEIFERVAQQLLAI
ncbi:TetR/AcrR family transcriptional regulator [Glutamicibacter uratoxydans]|uniref:TetR/AcrR family transcriptional regulator n=1 Tax=Glutamicibacter uratoxydans TaxID=43667 RepID=UPI003D6F1318